MKIKLFLLLAFISFQGLAQTKPCQLPRSFAAHMHDWIIVEDSDCTATNKMTIADFLSTLGVNFDSTGITGEWLKVDGSVTGATTFAQNFDSGVSLKTIRDNGTGLSIEDNSGTGVDVTATSGGIRGSTAANVRWKGKSGSDSSYIDVAPTETKIITKKGNYTTQLRNRQYNFSWSFGRSGRSSSIGGDSLGMSMGYQHGARVALFGIDDSRTYLYDDFYIQTTSNDTLTFGGGNTYISNPTSFGIKSPVIQLSPVSNNGHVIVGATNTGAIYPVTTLYPDSEYYTKSQVDSLFNAGTYTPTITNTFNIDATTTLQCQYMRVGNVVTVSGAIIIDVTADSVLTSFYMSLPINSTMGVVENAGGSIVNGNIPAYGQISGGPANNVSFAFLSGAVLTADYYSFSFTYIIN